MNLKEFFDYKTNCPLCDTKLELHYNSMSKQQCLVINDSKFCVKIPRRNFKHKIEYYVEHIFDMVSEEYYIEFYNKENVRLDKIHLDKWRYRVNMAYLYKHCFKCNNFNYNADLSKIKNRYNLNFTFEQYTLNDKSNRFMLQNYIKSNHSIILYGKIYDDGKISPFINRIETEVIPFTTKDKILNKLQTLVTFS